MSQEIESEDLAQGASGDITPICGACSKQISTKFQYFRTNCGHTFHKSCLAKCKKIRPYCPVCNTRLLSEPPTPSSSGATTRSQSKTIPAKQTNNQSVEDQSSSAAVATGDGNAVDNSVSIRPSEHQEIISSIVSAQHARLVASLKDQISRLVQDNVESRLSRLNINEPSYTTSATNTQPHTKQTSPRQMQTLPSVEERTFREMFGISLNNSQNHAPLNTSRTNQTLSHNSATSDLSSRPDKVLHIMTNWRIKFSGSLGGLSVENFIYRVEALTLQTLQGDFDLLCRNASSLFEGKAADWYWRHHRSVSSVNWTDLCKALRQHYSDSRSDVDIRELIRDRKQRSGESFDAFYDSVVELTDRLKEPLSNVMLVEILRRNLLPEIQHEILNLRISSIQELRDICKRREFFLQDVRRKHGAAMVKTSFVGKKVYGLNEMLDDDADSPVSDSEQVSAITLNC